MNKFLTLALVALQALAPVSSFAGTTTFQTDTAKLGRPNSNNKDLIFDLNLGASNPKIRANGTTNQLSFSNDGTTFNAFGTGSGSGQGTNYLADSNGQSYPTGTNWTVTNGTGSADTTNYTDSLQSIKVTASSQQSVLSQDVTPTTQLSGQNLQATMWVKTSLTNVQVCARVAGVETNCQPVSSANTWAPYTATMVGPASGSIGVDVSMTSSGTGTFNAQLGYVGKAVNTSQVSQAQWLGSVQIVGCSGNWNTTSGSFVSFSAQTGCTMTATGGASVPATMIPAIKFASLPPGHLVLVANGAFGESGASTGSNSVFRFYDGTNGSNDVNSVGSSTNSINVTGGNLVQSFDYTTAQSGITFQVQGLSSNAGANAFIANSSTFPFTVSAYFYPSQQQAGFRADATPASWSGYHNGITAGCTVTSSTFADASGCTGIALTQLQNRNFGTVTTAASSLPGLTVNFPRAGNYWVCAQPYVGTSSTNNSAVRLVDGSGTIINQGTQIYPGAGSTGASAPVCGIYNVASVASAITLKVQGATASGNEYVGWQSGQSFASGTGQISWSIVELDAPMPAPYLTGSVLQGGSGIERLNRARVTSSTCTSSPCTIDSQNNPAGLTSITRNSTGDYTINFAAGEYSAAPTCIEQWTAGQAFLRPIGTLTATAVEFACYTDATLGTKGDCAFQVLCMGPH